MHYFPILFGKELYVFRIDLPSIIRSLNTVFKAYDLQGKVDFGMSTSLHWSGCGKAVILIIKVNEMHYFSVLFGKELYMFRTDLLSIIRILNTVFTALGTRICHASYVDCLLVRSE